MNAKSTMIKDADINLNYSYNNPTVRGANAAARAMSSRPNRRVVSRSPAPVRQVKTPFQPNIDKDKSYKNYSYTLVNGNKDTTQEAFDNRIAEYVALGKQQGVPESYINENVQAATRNFYKHNPELTPQPQQAATASPQQAATASPQQAATASPQQPTPARQATPAPARQATPAPARQATPAPARQATPTPAKNNLASSNGLIWNKETGYAYNGDSANSDAAHDAEVSRLNGIWENMTPEQQETYRDRYDDRLFRLESSRFNAEQVANNDGQPQTPGPATVQSKVQQVPFKSVQNPQNVVMPSAKPSTPIQNGSSPVVPNTPIRQSKVQQVPFKRLSQTSASQTGAPVANKKTIPGVPDDSNARFRKRPGALTVLPKQASYNRFGKKAAKLPTVFVKAACWVIRNRLSDYLTLY